MLINTPHAPVAPVAHTAGWRGNGNYSDEVKAQRLKMASHVAIGAADIYVTSLGVLSPASDVLPWMGGIMTAAHALYGLKKAAPIGTNYYGDPVFKSRSPRDTAVGLGHLITAAGMFGLTQGMGAVALPIVLVGQATALSAEFLSRDE